MTNFEENDTISKKLWKYIDDDNLMIFEMCHLPREIRERFTSDMRIVEMLRAVGQLKQNEKGERWRMCDLLRKYREDGLETGRKEGREEGRKEGKKEGRREGRKEGRKEGMQALISTCKRLNAGFDVTMEELKRNFMLDEEAARQQMKLYW